MKLINPAKGIIIVVVGAWILLAVFAWVIKITPRADAYQLYGTNRLAMMVDDRIAREIGDHTKQLAIRTNYAKFDYDAANNQPGGDFSYTNDINVTMEQVFPGMKEKYFPAITWNETRLEKFNQTINAMRIGYLARADQVTFTTLSNLCWTNFFPASAPTIPAIGSLPHPFFIGK